MQFNVSTYKSTSVDWTSPFSWNYSSFTSEHDDVWRRRHFVQCVVLDYSDLTLPVYHDIILISSYAPLLSRVFIYLFAIIIIIVIVFGIHDTAVVLQTLFSNPQSDYAR